MDTVSIWTALRAHDVSAAIKELEHYPECNTSLNVLIRSCIKAHDEPYTCWNDFQANIDWLVQLSLKVDIEPIFRAWLENIENGFSVPWDFSTRMSVLSEVLCEGQPIFEFEADEMTPERRFLVDFGFARIETPAA